MMEFVNPDPIGEYIRTCPYCEDVFTAQHMNREFCPEKNGLKDYCKNRYKRLVRKGETADVINYDPDILINAVKLRKLLGSEKKKILEDKDLIKLNYNFDAYDSESPIHRANFYSVIVENYAIEIASVDRKGTFYKIWNLDF